MRLHHRARVKRRDLVVVPIGHDHRLGGVGVAHLTHATGADTQTGQALQVLGAIAAQHGHGKRRPPQQLQAVGDVARTPAKIAAQCGDQKGDIQNMQLIGQYLL